MKNKINFIIVIATVFCMLLLPIAFAADTTEIPDDLDVVMPNTNTLGTEDGSVETAPGEEIDTGEGFQNVVPTYEDVSTTSEEYLPITDDMLRGPAEIEEVRSSGAILYIAGGISILLVILIIVILYRKDKI